LILHVTDRATRDIEDIRTWIEADDQQAAIRVALKIMHAIDLLDAKPQIGRVAADGKNREWSIPGVPYLIAYRVSGVDVTILRVFHTSRLRPGAWN